MRTLVPAKRRVNPWKVARWTGLAVIVGVLGYCLIVWPWVIALTTDAMSDVGAWPGMPAGMLLVIQATAALTAFFIWLIEGGPEAVWKWLKKREATYDRKHTPEDDR